MTRRKLRVPELPVESIGAVRTLDEADRIFKRIFGERPPATRQDIPPQGWAKVRWVRDRVFLCRGESI